MNSKLDEIKIYLLDRNAEMTRSWAEWFARVKNVEIVNADFADFMNDNKVMCVVSPANSYGLMDGGYDAAITSWFGDGLQKKVQAYILNNFYGEQPVGSSFVIDTGKDDIKLIHTPTMRRPERIRDPLVVYQCMRTCLMVAMDNDIDSIVIPAFGGHVGRVDCDTIAKMMYHAYKQLFNPPDFLNWTYVSMSSIKY